MKLEGYAKSIMNHLVNVLVREDKLYHLERIQDELESMIELVEASHD